LKKLNKIKLRLMNQTGESNLMKIKFSGKPRNDIGEYNFLFVNYLQNMFFECGKMFAIL